MRHTIGKHVAKPMVAPSPLVGEGITGGRTELGWVRGTGSGIAMGEQPLTRLRFAKPPSPTGGEGKSSITQRRKTA
jgi:hypothetical protein